MCSQHMILVIQSFLDDLLKIHVSMEEKYNIARGKLENAR